MVIPKIGTQYILKKVADEMLAKPASAAESTPQVQEVANVPQKLLNKLDGTLIRGADGEPVGIARLVPGAAVFVIAHPGATASDEIRQCLEEEGSRILYLWTDDLLTGVVFVPDSDRIPPPPSVMRADDI